MTDEIKKAVEEFKKLNGNKEFTTKELVIYFNTQQEKKIDKIENKLDNLPCDEHLAHYNKAYNKYIKELNKIKLALNTEVTERNCLCMDTSL